MLNGISAIFACAIMREYIIKSDVGTELTVEAMKNSEKGVARNTYSLMKYIIKKELLQ